MIIKSKLLVAIAVLAAFGAGVLCGVKFLPRWADRPVISGAHFLPSLDRDRAFGKSYFHVALFCENWGMINEALAYFKSDPAYMKELPAAKERASKSPAALCFLCAPTKSYLFGVVAEDSKNGFNEFLNEIKKAYPALESRVVMDPSPSARPVGNPEPWILSIPVLANKSSQIQGGQVFVAFACDGKPWMLQSVVKESEIGQYVSDSLDLLYTNPTRPNFPMDPILKEFPK